MDRSTSLKPLREVNSEGSDVWEMSEMADSETKPADEQEHHERLVEQGVSMSHSKLSDLDFQ